MKYLLFTLFLIFSGASLSCTFGDNSTCQENHQCVFTHANKPARCLKSYMGEIPKVLFPYDQSTAVKCWKSQGRVSDSSHAWINSLYAIDLHGPRDTNGKIYAGASGRVISFGGCENNTPMCNSAFGNQIKILSVNGIMLYYVHLSEIYVKTGDSVVAGQVIGREGATGNVGGMWGEENDFHHLHLSVHFDWRNYNDDFHLNTYPGMDSIPFKFIMADNLIRDMRKIECSKFSEHPDILYGPIY